MQRYFILVCLLSILIPFSAQSNEKSSKLVKVEAKKRVRENPNQPWEWFDTRTVDRLGNFKKLKADKVNQYSSTTKLKSKATGFFRVEKINGRWWIIDPEGYCNIQMVINGFRKGKSERNEKSFKSLYTSDNEWVQNSAKKFANIGLNGTGSWSTDALIQSYNSATKKHKLSYSMNLSIMAAYGKKRGGTYQLPGNIGFPNQAIFVFDPEFKTFSDSLAKKHITKYKNDPNLFGYFSDNELPFGLKNLEGYLTLKNANDPGRLAAEKWLNEKGVLLDNITDKERYEFAGFVADKYYSIVSESIRKADPNHLYLGSRLHGSAKFVESIMKAAGNYCDIVSINYYGVWTPVTKHLNNWAEWAKKPFIITEFYTKGEDSGLANTSGAGWTVRTQNDRGLAYQDFCLALLESKNCVGWHYFKYQDNDPTAKGVDPSNIDSNKGIVDNDYRFYEGLVSKIKQLNRQVYSIINHFDR